MILICDSGSTKADWAVRHDGDKREPFMLKSEGLNPYFTEAPTIRQEIGTVKTKIGRHLKQELKPLSARRGDKIFFYGAGCTPGSKTKLIRKTLDAVFGSAKIEVYSDMVGAARALCGHEEGIACILGTGSNSCLYDGEKIVQKVPSLGYVLGDEGSGNHIGKLLVGNVLKGLMPPEVTDSFHAKFGSERRIVDRVYNAPYPNRWLASLSPFIWENIGVPEVEAMVVGAFRSFFERNVMQYHRPDLPVHFVGSVAHVYEPILRRVAGEMGLMVGSILKKPINKLLEYHSDELTHYQTNF